MSYIYYYIHNINYTCVILDDTNVYAISNGLNAITFKSDTKLKNINILTPQYAGNTITNFAYMCRSTNRNSFFACSDTDSIYDSVDFVNWTQSTTSGSDTWTSIASSFSSITLVACSTNGGVYANLGSMGWVPYSTGSSPLLPIGVQWSSITCNTNGNKIAVASDDPAYGIYININASSGNNWTQVIGSTSYDWKCITCSSDGRVFAACSGDGNVLFSIDFGSNWNLLPLPVGALTSISSNKDGSILAVASNGGGVYIGNSTGFTYEWKPAVFPPNHNFTSVSLNATGIQLAASTDDGYIYVYSLITPTIPTRTMIGLATCANNLMAGPRATSNSICKITKKDNVFVTSVRVGDKTILIPCGMVKYVEELRELSKFISIQQAIELLIKKHDIPLPTKPLKQVKRYKYTTVNQKIIYPLIQFNASFRLGNILPFTVNAPDRFIVGKSYGLDVCNDDTKTFSSTIPEMAAYATYWFSTLNLPCSCVVRSTNGKIKSTITGRLEIIANQIIFTAIIFKPFYVFYSEYPENTNITIIYQTMVLDNALTYAQQHFFAETIVQNVCT
jgi:hypothetical protein